LIKSIGLSNVTLPHLLHALRFTEVACVQNAYHLANRLSQPVPFAPLGFGTSDPNAVLGRPEVVGEAARLDITPAQVALAWTLTASPNVLLIPGTSSLQHLRENLAAATVHLDAEAIRQLSPMRWQTPPTIRQPAEE
jgi:pyridoxine 4-dehydrogenase